jgi:hypothetical protein
LIKRNFSTIASVNDPETKFETMNFIEPTMINNAVNIAKYKLKLHHEKGAQSDLSIFEVAALMDVLRAGDSPKEITKTPIFFGFSYN